MKIIGGLLERDGAYKVTTYFLALPLESHERDAVQSEIDRIRGQ